MKNRLSTALLMGMAVALAAPPASAEFVGAYAIGNWTQVLNGGSIDSSEAPLRVKITGNNDASGSPALTSMTIAAAADGTVSFSWTYGSSDTSALFDPIGYLHNGEFTYLTGCPNSTLPPGEPLSLCAAGSENMDTTQSGSFAFDVLANDIFGFAVFTTDSRFGSATFTLDNFNGPEPTPEPGTLALAGLALAALYRRRRRS